MVFPTSLFVQAIRAGTRINPQGVPGGVVSLQCVMSFSRYIHSGKQPEFEARTGTGSGSVDFVKGLLKDDSTVVTGRFNYPQVPFLGNRNGYGAYNVDTLRYPQLETNADIVHIKLKRNNCFVTLTDSKGNKKAGVSTGQVAGKGVKIGRYSGEAAAEHMGREVRKMRIKSVVVKVSGFIHFKKKKDAILSFKEGYTNSRPGGNPIVHIEDTTRKPHNGCRKKKQRRI